MNSMDLVLEACSLDGVVDESVFLVEDGNEFLHQVITEASTNVTKKNIFQRIIGGIVKLWSWCCKQWQRFTAWCSRTWAKIRGKKTKGADDILEDVISSRSSTTGSKSNSVNSSASNAAPPVPSVTMSTPPSMPDVKSSDKVSSGKISTVSVNIPSSPKSELKLDPKIDLMIKPIKVSWDENTNHFGISINGARSLADGEVTGHGDSSNVSRFANIIIIANDTSFFDHIKSAFSNIRKLKEGHFQVDSGFVTYINKARAVIDGVSVQNSYVLPFDKIREVSVRLNEIMKLLEMLQDPETQFDYTYGEALKSVNWLLEFTAELQMGINAFTRVTQGRYVVDAQYIGTINNTADLDQFVKGMIDYGFPSKFIAYNAYVVADESLKGHANENRPIWGQSRAVMFPTNDKDNVIKIALSGWGISSNKSESMIFSTFKKNGGADLLVPVKKQEANGAVSIATRVRTDVNWSGSTIDQFIDKFEKFINDHKLSIDISDLHKGNIGCNKSGMPCALDYAWATRQSTDTKLASK